MDFKSYLQTSAQEIDLQVQQHLRIWERDVKKISNNLANFIETFIRANEGGKGLRGALVKLGYELSGSSYNPEIIKAAVAVELFQTSILAHDDIIDKSPLRRGKPTVYTALGGDHHAISQTICLGDIGFFLAAKAISDSKFPDTNKNKALSIFSQMVINTGLGEMLDVELPYLQGERKESDVITIHRLKAAHYTIVYPLSIGAALGGGEPELFNDFVAFGENLGIAFQIQDDILGVFGDESVVGKSVTSDIEEGKNTLLIIEALRKADTKQKEILDKYYGRGKIGQEELEQIKQVFRDTGALEYSQKKAEELVSKSKEVVEGMDISEEHKKILQEMADFMVKRDK